MCWWAITWVQITLLNSPLLSIAGQPVCHYSLQPLTLAEGACWKEAVPGLMIQNVIKEMQNWHLKCRREKRNPWLDFSELLCKALLYSAELSLESHLMRLPTDLYICSSCFYSLWSLPSPLDYVLLMAVKISPFMSSRYTGHCVFPTEGNRFCYRSKFHLFQTLQSKANIMEVWSSFSSRT